MAVTEKLLLADGQLDGLSPLVTRLRAAGYRLLPASSLVAAQSILAQESVDLAVVGEQLSDADGITLLREMNQASKRFPTLFLCQSQGNSIQMEALNAGADAFLSRSDSPEVLEKAISQLKHGVSTSKLRHGRPGNLSGRLANLSVVDLFQMMESGAKTGIMHISSDRLQSGGFAGQSQDRATLYFVDGNPIEAKLGELEDLNAIYRLLLWRDGIFEVEFRPVNRPDRIESPTQAILLEGMRRIDEWERFKTRLPPPDSQPVVDYDRLKGVELPEYSQDLLPLFDGERSLLQIVEEAQSRQTEGLVRVHELFVHRLLSDPHAEPGTERYAAYAKLDAMAEGAMAEVDGLEALDGGSMEAVAMALDDQFSGDVQAPGSSAELPELFAPELAFASESGIGLEASLEASLNSIASVTPIDHSLESNANSQSEADPAEGLDLDLGEGLEIVHTSSRIEALPAPVPELASESELPEHAELPEHPAALDNAEDPISEPIDLDEPEEAEEPAIEAPPAPASVTEPAAEKSPEKPAPNFFIPAAAGSLLLLIIVLVIYFSR